MGYAPFIKDGAELSFQLVWTRNPCNYIKLDFSQ